MTQKNNPHFLMILNDIAWFWSHRLPLADAILKRGWALSLATHNAELDPNLQKMGVRGCALPKHARSLNPLAQLSLLWGVAKVIKQTKPDIIHAVTLRYAFYAGIVTRLMGYKPVTFTVAGLGSLYTAPGIKIKIIRFFALPLIRFAFGGAGKFIIFQNPDDQKAMLDAGIVKEERTVVIRGSGVNLKEFPFQPYQQKEGDKPIVLFTSRLLREKGITHFIQAARMLKSEGVEARFLVAGDVYEDNVRSLTRAEIQGFHDEGVIEWLGQCDDMPRLLAESMMVVLPSYYGEGVPKVLLETAAIGRPIITCDAPGCREAVEHDVNGVLVAPKAPKEIAAAIKDLINDSDKQKRYGAAGRKRVEEDFHVDHVVEKTMAVYDTLFSEKDEI